MLRRSQHVISDRKFAQALGYIANGATVTEAAARVKRSKSWLDKRLTALKRQANMADLRRPAGRRPAQSLDAIQLAG